MSKLIGSIFNIFNAGTYKHRRGISSYLMQEKGMPLLRKSLVKYLHNLRSVLFVIISTHRNKQLFCFLRAVPVPGAFIYILTVLNQEGRPAFNL